MGVRHPRREELKRLEGKTLDARLLAELRHGMSCSLFEAQAVLKVVKEVYAPLFASTAARGLPGSITLVAVDADEPAGKPVADCAKRTITLRLHRGSEDDCILQGQGPEGFRLARIGDLCQQAMSQGALLTREDLAYRIFFVSPRTISRDLRQLRQPHPELPLPLRGTVHDIGPVLTHRVQIVQLALQGKTMSQICQAMHHSPAAVGNYLSTFTRCAQLHAEGMQLGQIAFLLQRGQGLIRRYIDLLLQCRQQRNLEYHLRQVLEVGGAKKKRKEVCR
jgi:hypothetical protein